MIVTGLLVAASLIVVNAHAAQRADAHVSNDFSLRLDYTDAAVQRDHPRAAQYVQKQPQRRISASRAKSIALERVRGAKFIDVQLVSSDTYRVRLKQNNGRIIDVYVDAHTGRVRK